MKVLILGCNGQLGNALTDNAPDFVECVGVNRHELDITNAAAIRDVMHEKKPDVVINAAAYTAVDKAESEERLATAVNVDGARQLALATQDIGARLIHISTDYVFDGASLAPYKADAPTHPLNIYGSTKRDGERAVLQETSGAAVIIRTSWLYGGSGSNFVNTMLKLMRERDELSVVADQTGTPTWSGSLAEAIWAFVRSPELSGIFHWSDGGETTWWEFAVAIQEEAIALG